MVHLVYCDNKSKELSKILDGSKTMTIRGAMGRKIPHSRVYKDEIIYFMEKGTKKITAKAVVRDVQSFVKLSDDEITKIIEENNSKLQLNDKQKERWHKKCLCLVEFKNVEKIEPLDFDYQNNMDDWLIIEKCCAIGDKKHQAGVDSKKEWVKNKLKDGHIFRKLNARGKIFIEYEPLETAWVPISGKNYEYIYCLWVAGSFKGKGIGKELLEYAINDSKEKGKSGICTLVSKKKKPFIGEKKFFEYYGFKVVDTIRGYELLALQFDNSDTPKFNDSARFMKIDNQEFTIYYSPECPYVEYEVNELTEYAKENNIKINFIKIDSLEKAKNVPCIFNNWANFYKGEFISNTILNANSFKKLID